MNTPRSLLTLLPGLALALSACGPALGGTVTTTTTEATTPATTDATTVGPGSSSSTTAPSTSTTSSTSSATSDATSCPFLCEPDVPPDPFGCDLFTQDCPEGQKCSPFDSDGNGAYNETKCVDVGGDDQHGEPCSFDPDAGTDTCAKGHVCWNLDENNEGACVAHCGGTIEAPTCAPDCSQCIIGSGGTITLCLTSCDPLTQDCTPDSDTCIPDPMGTGFVCVLDASGGQNPLGAGCEFANVCNKGLLCAEQAEFPHPSCEPEAIGCCTPFCDLAEGMGDQNPTCQALAGDVPGVECVPVFTEGDECTVVVGVCVIPQP